AHAIPGATAHSEDFPRLPAAQAVGLVGCPVDGPSGPPAGLVALPVALPAPLLGKVGADEGAQVPLFLICDAEQGNQGVVLGGVEGRQLATAKLDSLACLECLCFAVES